MLRTSEALSRWVEGAGRGQSFEYYRGFLIQDREYELRFKRRPMSYSDRVLLNSAANRAWGLYLEGAVTLTQRRNGKQDYSYLAIKS